MSDTELRKILTDVMQDLATGRVRFRSPLRMVRGVVLPAVMAASLGLSACDSRSVGHGDPDGGLDARADVYQAADAVYGIWTDAAPLPDAEPDEDADITDAGALDSGPIGVYLAPPPIDSD